MPREQKKIQDYNILEKIEESNFAVIYKVYPVRESDLKDETRSRLRRGEVFSNGVKDPEDKPLILKIAREKTADYNELISREFQILSQFQHPNIVSIFDYNVLDDGRAYFTQAYISGKPIHLHFKGYSEEALGVMMQVLNGLAAFHGKGFIHTDLKPGHILYDSKEKRAVLIDFGFAGNVSQEVKLAGTVGYMAPEVIKGTGIDQRSDLYSLGVIIYEIFSGEKLTDPYVPIKKISDEMNNTIARLVSKEPGVRPTIPELHNIFEKYLPSMKIEIPPYEVKLPDTGFIEMPEIIEKLSSARGQAIVITGDIGLGKTRLLKEMKFRYLMQDYSVLFYMPGEQTNFYESVQRFLNAEKIDFSGKEDKFQIYEDLTNQLLGYTKEKHVVIMVDDLDQVSDYDLKLFRYIGYGVQDANVLLIGTSQDNERVKRLGFETLTLRPFSIEETEKLLEKTFFQLKTAKDTKKITTLSDLANWLHKESGGNPLFIVETLKAIYENKMLYYETNQWQIKTDLLKEITIPKKLDDILETRLKTLGADEIKILKILCLANYPLEPAVISLMLKTDVSIQIERLKHLGLVREEIINNKRVIIIPNQILLEIIEKSLQQKERKSYSQSLINAIKTTIVDDKDYLPVFARLNDEVGNIDKAYDCYQRAAEIAEIKYDYDAALKYYGRIVEYGKQINSEKYPEVLLKIGNLNQDIGDNRDAIDYYIEALGSGDEQIKPKINLGLGDIYQKMGQFKEASDYLKKALKFMKPETLDYIETTNLLGFVLANLSKYKEAEQIFDELISVSTGIEDKTMKAKILYHSVVLEWFRNDFDKGIEKAMKLIKFCEKNNLQKQYALCASILGSFYEQKNDIENAHKYFDSAIERFSKISYINPLCTAMGNRALLFLDQGKLLEAKQLYEKTLIQAQKTDNRTVYCNALLNLALISESYGKFKDCLTYIKKAIEIDTESINSNYCLSMNYYKTGAIDKAKALLEDELKQKEEIWYYIGMALVDSARGSKAQAGEVLKKGLKLIETQNPATYTKVESFLKIIQVYYENDSFEKSLDFAKKLEGLTNPLSKEHNIASAFIKINKFNLKQTEKLDITKETEYLKEIGCIYDSVYLKKLQVESIMKQQGPSEVEIKKAAEDLSSIKEIFESLGAGLELNRTRELQEKLFPIIVRNYSQRVISTQYLETFSKLAEIISADLGSKDFTQNILDLVIKATNAERGALFLKTAKGMEFIAGRDMDQTTIKDASELSKTAIKELEKDRIVFAQDALSNPQFNIKKSIMVNQIRSLLCIPLSVSDNVIGAWYCDSRVMGGIFGVQDKDFLMTVSKILASVIEKSFAFKAMTEENILLKTNIIKEIGSGYLTGKSRSMKRIYKLIDSVAETNSPVLVLGETGTGKGMIARLIHLKSKRQNRKFISINCGTIPESLLESELFGHKRGAFTGAVSDKKGLLEEGEGGTIFLDEISNTSLSFQGKLLEAIEEKVIRRVGETKTRNIDVRFLFATNKDLEIEVEDNRFRKDLYYRINVFSIEVPPLRERASDIPLLAQFFLEHYTKEMSKQINGFTPDVMQQLREYMWSGNVRELQNVIERAVVLSKSRIISVQDIGFEKIKRDEILSLKEIRREAVIEALHATGWNVKKAAESLGIGRRSIYRYIKKYNIMQDRTISVNPESDQ
jgi:Nif-specific regulatory protein